MGNYPEQIMTQPRLPLFQYLYFFYRFKHLRLQRKHILARGLNTDLCVNSPTFGGHSHSLYTLEIAADRRDAENQKYLH